MQAHDLNGFFPVLIGGLGNQMFILVASWVCGRVHNCPVYLPSTISFSNPHLNSKKDYIQTLFQHFGKVLPVSELQIRTSIITNYKRYKPRGFGPWFPYEVAPGTTMDSYFQFYPPLAPYEHEIRGLFLKGLQTPTQTPKPNPNQALLHIRRGDYLNHPNYHFLQPMEYYEKAIQIVKEKNPSITHIKIFSDDIAWAKEQKLFTEKPDFFSFCEQEDEIDALGEMASCTGGAIIANSTFSWWGAFLGAYSVRAPVVYPSRWIAEDVPELCPKEWVRL